MSDINSLFQQMHTEGDLSGASLNALQLVDVSSAINGQVGLGGLNIPSSEVLLVSMLIDDSGSMSGFKTTEAINGHNNVLDALAGSKQRNSIVVRTQFFSGTVINDWVLLENAQRMSTTNYHPNLGYTQLFDQTLVTLGSLAKEVYEAKQQGQVARAGVLIVTDGMDNASKATERDVKAVVEDTLANETAICSFLGIGKDNFRKVAQDMGIDNQWILTTADDAHSIRSAFNLFSSSMLRASQNSTAFSQVSAGGFMGV